MAQPLGTTRSRGHQLPCKQHDNLQQRCTNMHSNATYVCQCCMTGDQRPTCIQVYTDIDCSAGALKHQCLYVLQAASAFPGASSPSALATFTSSGDAPTNAVSLNLTPTACSYQAPCLGGTTRAYTGTITVASPLPESITPVGLLDRCWWEGRNVNVECVIPAGQTTICT